MAKRGAAYIRESSEGQGEGFSPGAHRQKIYDWAKENGIEIIGEYCDLHSAWRKSEARPESQRLMSDAARARSMLCSSFTPQGSRAISPSHAGTSSSCASG